MLKSILAKHRSSFKKNIKMIMDSKEIKEVKKTIKVYWIWGIIMALISAISGSCAVLLSGLVSLICLFVAIISTFFSGFGLSFILPLKGMIGDNLYDLKYFVYIGCIVMIMVCAPVFFINIHL